MSMVGRLEDLALPDILQILSLSKKTGKLTLTRREGTGVILLHHGHVIYAASDSARETLGNILVCNKLISEATLMAALELQHRSAESPLLGAILVEKGYITKDVLERCIRQQIERVIYEFFTWRKGFFKFDLMDFADTDGLQLDTRDFLLKAGLSPEYLVLEGVRRLDELQRQAQAALHDPPPPGPAAGGGPGAGSNGSSGRGPAPEGPQGPRRTMGGAGALVELRSILQEIRAPNFTGEITLMIMRYAANLVSRGVFFVMKSEGICGMGQFGLGEHGQQADERVRRIKIPVDQPSVFAEVLDKRQTYLGPSPQNPWDERLAKELGGRIPGTVVAVPMIVNDTVVAILYGDNAADGRPIGEIEGLELLMNQAGLAMEKSLLELKIKRFEARLASREALAGR